MTGVYEKEEDIYNELFFRYPQLNETRKSVLKTYEIMCSTFDNQGVLYVAGNGGSAADSEHIIGELCKSFKAKRPISDELKRKILSKEFAESTQICMNLEGGLPAISLPSMIALNTAITNDIGADYVFAQSINALATGKDAFLGISTSGNSKNIINAMIVARAKGLKVIGLCGKNECKMDDICDAVIHAPDSETYRVQELHLPIYHALCAMIESHYWGH